MKKLIKKHLEEQFQMSNNAHILSDHSDEDKEKMATERADMIKRVSKGIDISNRHGSDFFKKLQQLLKEYGL